MQQLVQQRRQKRAHRNLSDFTAPSLVKPLIIVSAPRAGSTLLFETLARFPDLWTIGEESHEIIEGIPELHPAAHGYASNRLTAADATPAIMADLQDRFARQLRDRNGYNLIDLPTAERPATVRMLEKTPKNALRIPFLHALFPDAYFLFLYREPAANISSILEGWQTHRFIGYRALPGWDRGPWSFLLIPGWESLQDKPITEIATQQWRVANATILNDLIDLPRDQWSLVRYDELVTNPQATIRAIATVAGLCWDETVETHVAQALPLSRMTVSAPAPDKWRKYAAQLAPFLAQQEEFVAQIENLRTDV
ncbi:MAG: sulfotransferase [Caldilineaceae bacterium]|nr:sulfotransferase [Caldilineaceae bacterium]